MPHLSAVRLDTPLLTLPLLTRPLARLPLGPVRRVQRWSVQSQQTARRNAMVACTALAARRAEREDVESYLRELPTAAAAAHG